MVEQRLAGPIIRISIMTMILGGLLYPLAATGISQLLMPERANGSLIYENGHPVGSALIGQNVQDPALFHGRVSAI
ncbi:potassium-transporting ATPase subunit C, partial [Rossellomorea marisflavi]|uniref:potassium-transporting ATPase subunit C n=1 Tax=Rossellomorea marisflavi TaxID=189381 RepID=UPI00295E57D7